MLFRSVKNREILSGKGSQILGRLEAGQDALIPKEKNFAAFMKTFPSKIPKQVEVQARYLEGLIATRMEVPASSVRRRLLTDQNFMMSAFAHVSPEIAIAYRGAVTKLKGGGGTFTA